MALIYKITNKITKENYIGKTTRTLSVRLAEHKRDCDKYTGNNIGLYNAIQKYGWDEFEIEVIEDNIDNNLINQKEQYYIQLFDSYRHGYNGTSGGDGGRTSSKLSEIEVDCIIAELKDPNNINTILDIANKHCINASVISNINLGKSWRKTNEQYPIRNYSLTGITITQIQYREIVELLLHSDLSLQNIAKKYGLSESQMTAINQGYECYNNLNNYYKNIYNGTYPIRNTRNKKLDLNDNVKQSILYDIIFTSDSMEKIGKKYNISGNTLQYIQSGKRRKDITENFVIPLRKNIEINKNIYNNLYSKGDD